MRNHFQTDHIIANIDEEQKVVYTKDTNIPPLHEVADPELLADCIPDLVESHAEAVKVWEQWKAQGWWPKPSVKTVFSLNVIFVPEGNVTKNLANAFVFEGEIPQAKDMKEAKVVAEDVISRIMNRKRPAWMKIISKP